MYSSANSLFAGRGLKLPPITINSLVNPANSSSSRAARAKLVNGPNAIIVTSLGCACTCRRRKDVADSASGLVVGLPSSRGGTTPGGWYGGRLRVVLVGQDSVQAPL